MAAGAVAVVFERIVVAASGRVVAEHTDPGDLDQTVHFPALTSSLQLDDRGSDAAIGDAILDVVRYSGLASRERYRMEMTLHERLADGTCVPTDVGASVEFEPSEAVRDGRGPRCRASPAGVFVAYEHLLIGDSLIGAHDDCDDLAQTLRVAAPSTTPATTTATAPPTTVTPTTSTTSTTPTTSTTVTPTTTTATTLPATAVTPPGPNPLPRTGGDRVREIVTAAAAMVMIGAGLLLLARTARTT